MPAPATMSRGYSKVYNRKSNMLCPASIQFDKLFNENSNRPIAAKSAGTVGKWGVISCTSLRSTNYNEHDGLHGSKAVPVKPAVAKPKKFFKSRNIDAATPLDQPGPLNTYRNTNHNTGYASHQPAKKYGRANYGGTRGSAPPATSAAKKFFTSSNRAVPPLDEQTEAMNLTSPTKPPPREENKPPIVIRIFKGTAQLVNEVNETKDSLVLTHQQPPPPPETKCTLRITRRRNLSEANSDFEYVSSLGSVESSDRVTRSSDSATSPPLSKRSRDHTEEEPSNQDPDEQASDEEEPPASPVGKEQDPIEEVLSRMHERDSVGSTASEQVLDNTPSVEVDGSSTHVDTQEDENLEQTLGSATPPQEAATPQNAESSQETVVISSELELEDQEKLRKANEILSSTYVDFNSASEKLLRPDTPTAPANKLFLDHNWFSDSEDSNSIADQINTIASSQEADFQAKKAEDPEERDAPKDFSQSSSLSKSEFSSQELESGSSERAGSPFQKKGSIFKSRSLLSNGSRKRLALYKHKWSDDKEGGSKAGGNTSPSSTIPSQQTSSTTYSDFEEEFEPDKLTRVTSRPAADSDPLDEQESITSVKCPRKAKGFYTVVRNVKKAHQIQESGEFQEFNDDVEYILDALQDNNPIGTRCLSAITLASKCMAPAFRMHVRAHGTVTKFFKSLHDATKDQSLGLCTATVMFVLSQDRLNMDLDRHSLELMLNLLESDASHRNALDDCGMSSSQLHKNKQKVRELCAEIKSQGHANHLNIDNITASILTTERRGKEEIRARDGALEYLSKSHKLEAQIKMFYVSANSHSSTLECHHTCTQCELSSCLQVGQLAMETLLSLTSRRAGEWFKEELRTLGGLEHIVKTICECCRQIDDYVVEWTDALLDKLRKVDRCLKVLENVTHQNEENQVYLLNYGNGVLLDTLVRLYCQCDSEISLYPCTNPADKESVGAVIREVLLSTLKVLINLTHDFNNHSYGSALAGERTGLVDACLHLLLQVPNYVPEDKKFDLLVLALILLINLVESCHANRKLLFEAKAPADPEIIFHQDTKTAVEALIALFYHQEDLARAEEMKTDAILDGKKEGGDSETNNAPPKSQEEFIEETIAKLLQKAGRNMEHTLIGAYISLLLGYLIMDSKDYELYVRQCLPEGNFEVMGSVLQKVLNFMTLTASAVGSNRGIAQTERVIKCLLQSDAQAAASANQSSATLDSSSEPVELDLSMSMDVMKTNDLVS
uniref:WAPL domain-containing protein n=2 Tax=Timema TaxID=61471 RepID=A0A7R9D177_TIMPO|nr:unnamed protein product [Timema poppensis]